MTKNQQKCLKIRLSDTPYSQHDKIIKFLDYIYSIATHIIDINYHKYNDKYNIIICIYEERIFLHENEVNVIQNLGQIDGIVADIIPKKNQDTLGLNTEICFTTLWGIDYMEINEGFMKLSIDIVEHSTILVEVYRLFLLYGWFILFIENKTSLILSIQYCMIPPHFVMFNTISINELTIPNVQDESMMDIITSLQQQKHSKTNNMKHSQSLGHSLHMLTDHKDMSDPTPINITPKQSNDYIFLTKYFSYIGSTFSPSNEGVVVPHGYGKIHWSKDDYVDLSDPIILSKHVNYYQEFIKFQNRKNQSFSMTSLIFGDNLAEGTIFDSLSDPSSFVCFYSFYGNFSLGWMDGEGILRTRRNSWKFGIFRQNEFISGYEVFDKYLFIDRKTKLIRPDDICKVFNQVKFSNQRIMKTCKIQILFLIQRLSERSGVVIPSIPHHYDVQIIQRKNSSSIGPIIGQGAFGSVKYAESINTKCDFVPRSRKSTAGRKNTLFTAPAISPLSNFVALKERILYTSIEESLIKHGAYREALLHSMLHHKNIVTFFRFCRDTCVIYSRLCTYNLSAIIADSYVSGQNGLSARRILKTAYGISNAMTYLHNNHFIHGDLKSSNILLTSNFDVKVCDFGSLSFGSKSLHCHQSELCTFAYASPESLRDDGLLFSFPSDVWSFGIILFEMISGRLPFPSSMSFANFSILVGEFPELCLSIETHSADMSDDYFDFIRDLFHQCVKYMPSDRICFAKLHNELFAYSDITLQGSTVCELLTFLG